MKSLQKIFKIAKSQVSLLLLSNKINQEKITEVFGVSISEEIDKRIKDSKIQKERIATIDAFNLSKSKDFEKIQKKIKRTTQLRYLKTFSQVAAIFIVALGTTFFLLDSNYFSSDKLQENSIVSEDSKNSEDIILKLSNGKTQIIKLGKSVEITNDKGEVVSTQNGKKLNYSNSKTVLSEKLAYNELTVPNGKTLELMLSDSTLVYLNAGSWLKYPVHFFNGKRREVFLKGEAYLKVKKDKKHPFIVNAENLNIRVLGTEFNVSSYPGDNSINTVLVEGSVALYGKDKTYTEENISLLKPGKKAQWNTLNQKVEIKKVNTSIYTSWIHGTLVIENLEFSQIIQRLERHYNVEIINHNEELGRQVFTATFKVETIKEVLDSFKTNFHFDYSIKDKSITITNP